MVTLTNTLDLWRAHIVRGVLEEHGIPAVVRHDGGAAFYGPLACGGYELLVEEEDVMPAAEVLNTLPPVAADERASADPPRRPPSYASVLAVLLIIGVLAVAATGLLDQLMRLVRNYGLAGFSRFFSNVGPFVSVSLKWWIIYGMIAGLLASFPAWMLMDYRAGKGFTGRVFVGLLTAFLLLLCALAGIRA
ncbi:MAG TPA: DUF2007 domain-containing protein [Verrucomicrobiales bacterium]|nr:DUF2007 domain-containing protein [Verrucomicrobiales bacterium]